MDFYSGQVNATCDATALPAAQCMLSPSNPITIASGAAVASTVSINVPNSATPGLYNIKINTQDITGAPSSSLTIALTVNQDFAIGSVTPTTQTITVGESASYNLSVLPVGASFTGAVTLSCSSVPVISALCNFTPNPVTPGSSSAAVVMSINTTSSSASVSPLQPKRAVPVLFYALWMALPGLVLLGIRECRGKHAKLSRLTSLLPLLVLAWSLSSCGGGGSNGGGGGGGGGGGQQQGTQPGTYVITVIGASGTVSHSAASTVTLVVSQ